jgi:hypothetical protein
MVPALILANVLLTTIMEANVITRSGITASEMQTWIFCREVYGRVACRSSCRRRIVIIRDGLESRRRRIVTAFVSPKELFHALSMAR